MPQPTSGHLPTRNPRQNLRTYDLKYDVNASGVAAVDAQQVNWFDGITFAKAPERDGYEFAYWYYTDENGAVVKCTDGETTLADIVSGGAKETDAINGNATVKAKWLKVVNYDVYHHRWQHGDDGTFEYGDYKWDEYVGTPVTTKGVEEDELALAGIIGTFAGFKQFDLPDADANLLGKPAQRTSGVLTANDAENRFDIYYKERHDYTVKYDFNLGDDEIHKPLNASGDEIASIADVPDQWWTDKGYFTAIKGVDMDQSRLGYDFVEWSTDQGIKSTSDDQHLYELLGNTAPRDAENIDVEDGIVSLKARWNEQTAEIEYFIDSASNGMGTVVQHVNNAVADDSGDVLSEEVLKFHGNDVMGATAVPNPGYHFVQWMVNVDLSQKISEQRAAAERATTGGDTGDDTGGGAGEGAGDGTGEGTGTGEGSGEGAGDGTLGGQSVDESGITLVAQADDDTWYVYPASANMTPDKDANQLYPAAAYKAEFAKSSYTVAYDANYSGAPAIGTKTTASWDAIGLLGTVADPVREGYTFDGWFTAPGGGKQVTKDSKYNAADLSGATATLDGAEVDIDTDGATVTLYAHWTIIAPTNDELIKLIEEGDKLDGDGTVASKDGSDVYKTAQWVPESVKKELEDALEQAKKVADDPNATPEDRIAAYDRLEDAINAYKAAKKYGTSSDSTAKGGPNAAPGTKGNAKAPAWKAPTTGDHLADAMIVIGAVALVAAFVLAFILRRRERN